jgi:hypothetical protein
VTTAQPYPVVNRIPEDQPFVVRHSRRKRGVLVGSVALALEVMMVGIAGLVLVGRAADGTGLEIGDALIALAGIAVVFAAVFGGFFLFQTSGGPVLAAGPAGLWIRTRPTRGQAIWLPWEAIALISRRRWGVEKMLVVRPRDRRAENLGVLTAFDGSIARAVYASGFTATINMADRPEAEILQAVAYFAANRVPLT